MSLHQFWLKTPKWVHSFASKLRLKPAWPARVFELVMAEITHLPMLSQLDKGKWSLVSHPVHQHLKSKKAWKMSMGNPAKKLSIFLESYNILPECPYCAGMRDCFAAHVAGGFHGEMHFTDTCVKALQCLLTTVFSNVFFSAHVWLQLSRRPLLRV